MRYSIVWYKSYLFQILSNQLRWLRFILRAHAWGEGCVHSYRSGAGPCTGSRTGAGAGPGTGTAPGPTRPLPPLLAARRLPRDKYD